MERKQGIGGSEVAAILGISPWEGPLQVYARKVGLVEPGEPNLQMKVGRALEELLLKEYQAYIGKKVVGNSITYAHPTKSWRLATPDGFVVNEKRAVLWGVEAKTAQSPIGWGFEEDAIPEHYLVQVLWYRNIMSDYYNMDIPWWDVVCLIGNRELRFYRIHKNDELEEMILDAVDRFWNEHVVKLVPPEPTSYKDRDITQKIKQTTQEFKQATPEEEELIQRLKNAYIKKRIAEREFDLLVAKVQSTIGGYKGLVSSYGTITWQQAKPQKVVDWKAVAMEFSPSEELIAKFTEERPGIRRFCVPKTWQEEAP